MLLKVAILMAEGDEPPADPVAYASRWAAVDPDRTPFLVALFRLGAPDLASVLSITEVVYRMTGGFDVVVVAKSMVSGATPRERTEHAVRLLKYMHNRDNVVVVTEDGP